MRLIVLAVVFGIGMGIGMAGPQPDQFTLEEIEGWPEFREAVVKPLVVRPIREVLPIQAFQAGPPEVPDQQKLELTRELRGLAERLGIGLSEPLEFASNEEYLTASHRLATGEHLEIGMVDGALRRVTIGAKGLPGTGALDIAKEHFPAYAAKIYATAFRAAPHGELSSSSDRELTWVPRLPGVVLEDPANVTIRSGHDAGLTILYLTMGPDPVALATHLEKHPTLVTAEQAMALAWKTVKDLVAEGDLAPDSTRVFFSLRSGTAGARAATPNMIEFYTGQSASDPAAPAFDPIFYQIELRDGIFHARVDVDRRTGTVIHLRYGRMSW